MGRRYYETLASHPSTPKILRSLYSIMCAKKTNLCVAADVTTALDLIDLIHKIGPFICILKTHIDIIVDFTPELTRELVDLADKYQFLLFEDRKFADIGNTVMHQYRDGMYHISSWAHIINCHPIPGPGLIQGLAKIGTELGRGLLLISDMSSEGWLGDMSYRKACLDIATAFPDFVIGWISGSRWHASLPGVVMTPGISLESTGDALGQQYKSPAKAIGELGSDIIIVGRSIIGAANPADAAQMYQKVGWDAYLGTLD